MLIIKQIEYFTQYNGYLSIELSYFVVYAHVNIIYSASFYCCKKF